MISSQADGYLLRLIDISKSFESTVAIQSISIDVSPGEFLTLVGPSGSGKSTLLSVIAGFVQPDRGSIYLNGLDITDLAPEHRRFGVVPQGYALFPHLSVIENVAFPLRVRGIGRERLTQKVEEALDLVQITALRDRYPNQLSGGQQQRVALARALVFEPDILLLDEPMSALDASLRRDLQQELVHLQRRLGTTFVYVTHDQHEALALSDRVAVLRGGRVEQIGSPRQLYQRPETEFVAGFLGKNNLLFGTVERSGREHIFRWQEHVLPLASYAAADLPLDRSVLSIRPEFLRLSPAGKDSSASPYISTGPEIWTGTVVEQVFHGASVDTLVSINGQVLTHTGPARDAIASSGDVVSLSFDADGLWFLPPNGVAAAWEHIQ